MFHVLNVSTQVVRLRSDSVKHTVEINKTYFGCYQKNYWGSRLLWKYWHRLHNQNEWNLFKCLSTGNKHVDIEAADVHVHWKTPRSLETSLSELFSRLENKTVPVIPVDSHLIRSFFVRTDDAQETFSSETWTQPQTDARHGAFWDIQ